ncbi:MAG TPA: hypothetical protein VGD99_14480 [Anaerolineae bacterium]|jgi:hypothetical protein
MWVGVLGASVLADGLPPQVLDTKTGQVYSVALDSSIGGDTQGLSGDSTALVNPRYQSWSPDSAKLVITAGGYRFVTNDAGLMTPQTGCSYNGRDLEELLNRRLLEVWLLGYRATEVQRLDKEAIDYSEAALCNPQESTCTKRPGHHFVVRVTPSSGYQIIRFPGVEDVLVVHLMDEDGQELLELPQPQPDRWQAQNNWTDLPYEVCFSSPTWQRPSDETLERFAKGDPRYTVQMIKTSPLWTDDFLLYPGGAGGHTMLFNLGGFWTAEAT